MAAEMTYGPFPFSEDEQVCSKCEAKNPDRKYGTRNEGLNVLDDFLLWTCWDCGFEWFTECADTTTERNLLKFSGPKAV